MAAESGDAKLRTPRIQCRTAPAHIAQDATPSHITRFFFLLLAVVGAIQPSYAQINGEWKTIRADHSLSSEVLPAPAQDTFVSFRKPDGLILSQGNLYFTSHDAAGATVWRT